MFQCSSQDQLGPEPDGPTPQLHPDHSDADEHSSAATNSGQSHASPVWDLQVSAKQHRHGIAQFSTISFIILRNIKVGAQKSVKA